MARRLGGIRVGIDGGDTDNDGLIDEVDETHDIGEDEEDIKPTSSIEDLDETFRRIFQDERKWTPEAVEKLKESYLKELEEDLPESPKDIDESVERSYSIAEMEQLADDDPGFINEKAMKPLDRVDPNDAYMQLGLHFGTVNYGKDAVDGTVEKYSLLVPGKILERRGDENGNYLSDPNVKFEDLQLPYVEEKYKKTQYCVEKPFVVEKSTIESQPFDERSEERREEAKSGESAVQQYKTYCSIAELVNKGYLRRISD